MRSRRPRGDGGGGGGPARAGPFRRDDVRPREVPILAVSVVVVLAAVANDVRFSPAVAWLLASLNLALIVIALGMFLSTRKRASGEPRPDEEVQAPIANPNPAPRVTGDESVTSVQRSESPDTPSVPAPPRQD